MPSLIEALEAREAAARGRADRLREQIAGLSEELSRVEAELSRLRIIRETVDEVLSDGPGAAAPVGNVELAVLPLTDLAPVMLAAEASGDATVTSPAHRRILVAFAEAPGPLRCKDVCAAVGLGTQANHVEGMRSKLKRLVERQILAETEPGLFTLSSRSGAR
ncbi:hypothetical protein [Streptomyces hirsutus]|uniref:hypothetical protein n=1 Tax=Streptomyces hirsutus TaxID=35620 RepID=UPI0007C7C5B7|nr:hypothetical protein [Streptomyces hirsutus]